MSGPSVWSRQQATGPIDRVAIDELDAVGLLVLDGVAAADDHALDWCRSAPCVVVGVASAGASPSKAVDVALAADEASQVDAVDAAVQANPLAARTLVHVLRAVPALSVIDGLLVESLAYSMLQASAEHRRWLGAQPARPPRSFDRPPVQVQREGPRLRITLDRPENRNAFSAPMRDALLEALDLADLDPAVEAVTIDGAGPTFCSGGDLAEFGSSSDAARAHEIRTLRSVGARLARNRVPITVRVHGRCVGAGVELSAFASRVVAHADSTFRLPEVAMGLIPGAGGTVSVSRRLGRQATTRLALLGSEIDAVDARRMGLVDEIEP